MTEKRILGRTGMEVSTLGFGAWGIGGMSYGEVSERDAAETIEAYLDAGGNFIDTAQRYGKSEQFVGDTLARLGCRDKVILSTKTHRSDKIEDIPNIRKDLESSLRLLKTDYIDLYFMHHPSYDPEVMHRVADEYDALKAEGKIRAIGASIIGPAVYPVITQMCRHYIDAGRVDAIQLIYSILRQGNLEAIEYAREKGVGIVARTALENGFLTGKYRRGANFNDHRNRWQRDSLDRLLGAAEDLQTRAVPEGYPSILQTAIRFATLPEGVSTLILGAKSRAQMESNMAVESLPPFPADLAARLQKEYAGRGEEFNPEPAPPQLEALGKSMAEKSWERVA